MKLGDYVTFNTKKGIYAFGKIVAIRNLIEKHTSKKYTNIDIETILGNKYIEIPLKNIRTYD